MAGMRTLLLRSDMSVYQVYDAEQVDILYEIQQIERLENHWRFCRFRGSIVS